MIGYDVLSKVEKPARYTGGELNSINKSLDKITIRFAFCFPDVYEIGMSNLGMKILYALLNEREDTYCERVFSPWVDMEQQMKENKISLFSLETKDAVRNFDFLGFTLQYELSYTNIINMLHLAGIPFTRHERKNDYPIICAGGPCACNPEILADIMDFFVIGDGDEVVNEILDTYNQCKNEGFQKHIFLNRISNINGVYVPELYDVEYLDNNTIKKIVKQGESKDSFHIKKRVTKNLDKSFFPEKVVVPYIEIVHDRIMLEMFRGCVRGCRFCQAGFIYRPVRQRSVDRLLELAEKLENSTGYEEISLVSLSTGDYCELESFTDKLINIMNKKRVNISLPSLRVDSFSLNLMQKAQKVRKAGLTFAPEAGTQRLRDLINKDITEEEILESIDIASRGGWSSIKLYFMIGLPTETNDDLQGIADLCNKALSVCNKNSMISNKKTTIKISVSSFIPKPFTPFQWEAQDTKDVLMAKQKFLKDRLNKRVEYSWHDADTSFVDAILARGDRRLGKVIIKAWEKGCKFDGWDEFFELNLWMKAFEECGIDPHFYACRKRNYDEVLPWSHIDMGVSTDFLISESLKAYKNEVSINCRDGCLGCGISCFVEGACSSE